MITEEKARLGWNEGQGQTKIRIFRKSRKEARRPRARGRIGSESFWGDMISKYAFYINVELKASPRISFKIPVNLEEVYKESNEKGDLARRVFQSLDKQLTMPHQKVIERLNLPINVNEEGDETAFLKKLSEKWTENALKYPFESLSHAFRHSSRMSPTKLFRHIRSQLNDRAEAAGRGAAGDEEAEAANTILSLAR